MNTHAWYASKTLSILEKYGTCGPRVHYHLGFCEPTDELLPLAERMHTSQERLLEEAFSHWGAPHGRVLDLGCGLGGTSLWMAQHYDVHVTALTNVAEHARQVRERSLGLPIEVVVDTAEAHSAEYDTIVCCEAANLFDREAWLDRANASRLLIDDYFLGDPALKPEFDAAFASNIDSMLSYIALAEARGWVLQSAVDVSARSARFWRWCAEFGRGNNRGWHQTAEFHERMYQLQLRGGYRHALLQFTRGKR